MRKAAKKGVGAKMPNFAMLLKSTPKESDRRRGSSLEGQEVQGSAKMRNKAQRSDLLFLWRI